MISRIALIAAAGLLLGAAITPAKAADLGGGCCADLEERVAELEATTARKGNRVVTLQIYGTVAKGLLIWDNGEESDAYVVDDDVITSILGFKGKAALKPGWSAGFKVELQVSDASSAQVTSIDDEGSSTDDISIRESNVYIESERLGRITIGQQVLATDGVGGVSLANILSGPGTGQNNSLEIGGSAFAVFDVASDFGAGRDDAIRYDSPSIYGFIVSAAWGDDDYYDVALRFAKEWNSIKIAAAIGYANRQDENVVVAGVPQPTEEVETLSGSISVMHVPTGLFANFSAGEREIGDEEASYWYVAGGVERKWLSYGATTLFAEYGIYEDVISFNAAVDNSEAERLGFGIVQHFDSAALDIYARAIFYNFEIEGDASVEDMSTVMLGAKIDF